MGWAQRRAAALFRQACAEGLMRRHSHVCGDSGATGRLASAAGLRVVAAEPQRRPALHTLLCSLR